MNNGTIRIALSSVLIFIAFKKLYDLLTAFLLWIVSVLRFDNEFLLILINVFLGLFCVWLLIMFSHKILRKEKIEDRVIYYLIGLTVFLTICMGVVNKLYGEYLANTDLGDFNTTHLFQFSWSNTAAMVLPILGLLYFLFKMKKIK